jgi:hypothetical protein
MKNLPICKKHDLKHNPITNNVTNAIYFIISILEIKKHRNIYCGKKCDSIYLINMAVFFTVEFAMHKHIQSTRNDLHVDKILLSFIPNNE